MEGVDLALVFLVAFLVSHAQAGEHAQEHAHKAHPPTLSLSNGVTYALGNHEHGEQLMTVHGVRFAAMLGRRVKWSVEGGAYALPTIEHDALALEFGPYAQTGPGVVLTERFSTSVYVTWKLHGDEHLLGAAVAPTFGTPGGNVNVPIGGRCAVGEPMLHCTATVSVKAVTDLRFK